jgi:hypothetical protein
MHILHSVKHGIFGDVAKKCILTTDSEKLNIIIKEEKNSTQLDLFGQLTLIGIIKYDFL